MWNHVVNFNTNRVAVLLSRSSASSHRALNRPNWLIYLILLDINQSRLDFAKKIGADHTLLVKPGQTPEEIAKAACAFLGGSGFQKIIECSGAEISIQTGLTVSLRSDSNRFDKKIRSDFQDRIGYGLIYWLACPGVAFDCATMRPNEQISLLGQIAFGF